MRNGSFAGAAFFVLAAISLLTLPLWIFSDQGTIWDMPETTLITFKSLEIIGLVLTVAAIVSLGFKSLPFLAASYLLALGIYIHRFAPYAPGDLEDVSSFLVISGGMSVWAFVLAWMCIGYPVFRPSNQQLT